MRVKIFFWKILQIYKSTSLIPIMTFLSTHCRNWSDNLCSSPWGSRHRISPQCAFCISVSVKYLYAFDKSHILDLAKDSGTRCSNQFVLCSGWESNRHFRKILQVWVNVICHHEMSIKGSVNPDNLSKPDFFVLFTILDVTVYSIITNTNHLP